MKQFNLNYNIDNSESYTINQLVPGLEDMDNYAEFLYNLNDLKDINRYVDNFVNYVFDVIDESNRFVIVSGNKKLTKLYLNTLNNDLLFYIDDNLDYNDRKVHYYLYYIDNEDSKKILKDNLLFNIGDECWEPVSLNVKNSHISKDASVERDSILYLIKDDTLLISFWLDSGYILDYRGKEVIRKHQEKYRALNRK